MKKTVALLAIVLMIGAQIPTLAAEQGNTAVMIEVKATTMDVTVPSTLPIVFHSDGTNTVPTDFTITNNSNISGIHLLSIDMNANGSGWRLMDATGDTKALAVDTKDIQFYAGKEGTWKLVTPETAVAETGSVTYEAADIPIPAASSQVLSFRVNRGSFNTAVTEAKAFDMVMTFAFN